MYIGSFGGLRAVHRESGVTRRTYPDLDEERVEALLVSGSTVFVGTEHGLAVVPAVTR